MYERGRLELAVGDLHTVVVGIFTILFTMNVVVQFHIALF